MLMLAVGCGGDGGSAAPERQATDAGDAGSTSETTESTAAEATGEPIKIGQLEPLTGGAAIYGLPNQEAVAMAVDEVNDAGGLDIGGQRRPVEVVALDTECDPEKGVAAFQRLVSQEQVKFVVGTTCSSVALAYQPLVAQNEVLSLVTGASSPGIASPPYMFHARATTEHYANAILRALEDIQPSTVALLEDQTHPGWTSQKETVINGLEEQGIEIVAQEVYKSNDTDFYPQLTQIKEAGADVLITMGGFAHDDSKIWAQARELGLEADIITQFAGTKDDYLEQVSAEAADGVRGVATPTMADFHEMDYQPAIEFEERFREATGDEVGFTTLSTYGGFYMLVRAIEQAGTAEDVGAVAEALANLTPEDVPEIIEPVIPVDGKLFSETGSVDFAAMLKQWQDGELVGVELYD